MIAYITVKSRFSNIPEQNRVMVTYEKFSDLVISVSDLVEKTIENINKEKMLGEESYELNSFDMKRVSSFHEDMHIEAIFRLQQLEV